MKILSHRGYWEVLAQKNSLTAFKRSLNLGFGLETDVRDCAGRLVIAHDRPSGDELSLENFLQMYEPRSLPLALNIKADGLVEPLQHQMRAAGIVDWFVFDMSIPDMRSYLKAGVPVFARMSEVEQNPAWMDQAAGIWLDSFFDTWYNPPLIETLLNRGLRVCVVSPELHGRDYQPLWAMLTGFAGEDRVMLCTDFPEQARDFFKITI